MRNPERIWQSKTSDYSHADQPFQVLEVTAACLPLLISVWDLITSLDLVHTDGGCLWWLGEFEVEDAPVPTEQQMKGPNPWAIANVWYRDAPNVPWFFAWYWRVGGTFLPEGNLVAFQLLRAVQFKQRTPLQHEHNYRIQKLFSISYFYA